jgi:hypothetical protein
MKILRLISNKEYFLEDDEADYIKQIIATSDFIPLSNGDLINAKAIERISEPDKKPHWNYYPLSQDKEGNWYFYRDGKRVYLESHNLEEIGYQDDPKYLTMPKISVLKQIEEENKKEK